MDDRRTCDEWTCKTLYLHFTQRFSDNDKALLIATDNLKGWQSNANEWRATVNDLKQSFVTKDRFDELKDRVAKWDGRSEGLSFGWSILLGACAIGAFTLSVMSYFK